MKRITALSTVAALAVAAAGMAHAYAPAGGATGEAASIQSPGANTQTHTGEFKLARGKKRRRAPRRTRVWGDPHVNDAKTSIDAATPKKSFRPNPAGDGTTEQFKGSSDGSSSSSIFVKIPGVNGE